MTSADNPALPVARELTLPRTFRAFLDTIPTPATWDILGWAERNVRLVGSARSEGFDRRTAPWLNQIIEWQADGVRVRKTTFVKPVQSGGSTAGEIALLYWLRFGTGFAQYNWPSDKKAELRYKSRVSKILKACKDLEWPADRTRVSKCEVDFQRIFFLMQGVFESDRLDSDSVKYQCNEEVHAFKSGHLAKAYGRTTAFAWLCKILNISNASTIGDELHSAYQSGTQQPWVVKCPGCRLYHAMRTRRQDERPDLGGLRYDSAACKRAAGVYDYAKLRSTLRYQMPCGFIVHEDHRERRALSLSGKYDEPQNAGADLSERSAIIEAVAVDWIPWIDLVMEKHKALRALSYGDKEPWTKYLQERECRFYDPQDRPLTEKITLNTQAKKCREGLPDRVLRGMAVDYQRGETAKGETPHFWVVLRDFRADASSRLVYEGKLRLIEDAEAIRAEHGVEPRFVLIDSGWNATEVYRICARYGYAALKGEDRDYYMHDVETEDGVIKVRRIYSPVQMMDPFEGDHGGQAGQYQIPLYLYSKQGIRNELAWLRSRGRSLNEEWNDEMEQMFGKDPAAVKFWDVPADVSDDYRRHMEAEVLRDHVVGRSQEIKPVWTRLQKRNDLFVCECYLTLLPRWSGLIDPNSEPEPEPVTA